jgi:hypothetical protein
MISDLSVNSNLSGVSLLPSKINDSYLIIPKIVIGIVDINNLSIVVVFESSARAIQKGSEAFGLSKNVKRAQLIQEALPNMVT